MSVHVQQEESFVSQSVSQPVATPTVKVPHGTDKQPLSCLTNIDRFLTDTLTQDAWLISRVYNVYETVPFSVTLTIVR